MVSGATAAARGTHTHARALWHAWPHSALCVEPAMARMLAILAVLDSSGVARCAVSSGDACGGLRQVGTASHVNRGRSFVWLQASVCVVRVSVWMPASECAQSIKRTRSFAAIPGSYGLEPVYDRSGELLDRYAAELIGAPAVPRALPHARAHSRRTIARASRPIPAIVAIRCGRTARALREGRRRPPG